MKAPAGWLFLLNGCPCSAALVRAACRTWAPLPAWGRESRLARPRDPAASRPCPCPCAMAPAPRSDPQQAGQARAAGSRLAPLWQGLRRTPALVTAMAVLGLALMGSSALLVKGLRTAKDTITVTGASTERIRSDFADWSLLLSQGGDSQQQAYRALQPLVQQTRAFLLAHGLQADELKLGSVNADREDIRDPRTGELRQTRWTSRQTLVISSADVDKVNRLAGEIPALIGEGVPLVINEPAYTYSKLAEKRVDMLAKATKDARNRAQAIAAQADSSIGAITNADTGTFQLTAPNSTDASNSGSYDTRTIEKDITAVMAVTFRVN